MGVLPGAPSTEPTNPHNRLLVAGILWLPFRYADPPEPDVTSQATNQHAGKSIANGRWWGGGGCNWCKALYKGWGEESEGDGARGKCAVRGSLLGWANKWFSSDRECSNRFE